MKYIGDIPVWGEHDQDTVAQIQRCAKHEAVAAAALMADGHKGYALPISGVIAYRDAISPNGVGFDISCLVAGTPVTTADGYWAPIEAVRAHTPITCWDGEQVRRVASHEGSIARPARETVRVQLANGRSITATADHLIYTRDGWKQAGALTADDTIACSVFVGLPYVTVGAEIPLALDNEKHAAELRQHGLYPLRSDSPLLAVVVRLLGVVCGAGHLTSNGKRVSVYTTVQADAEAIAWDFERLGYRPTIGR